MTSLQVAFSTMARIFLQVIGKFFEPLRKRPILVGCVIVILAVLLCISTGVAERTARNWRAASILAAEMITESGPCFDEAKGIHVDMLRRYVRYMDERPLSFLAEGLYPESSPQKALRSALSSLEEGADSAEQIRQAGQQINASSERAREFSRRQVIWL